MATPLSGSGNLSLFENQEVNRQGLLSLGPIGQKIDTLGKTRWLYFKNYGLLIPAISPFDDIPDFGAERGDIDDYVFDQTVVNNLMKKFIGFEVKTYSY